MADLADLQEELGGAAEAAQLFESVMAGLPDALQSGATAATLLAASVARMNANLAADAAAAKLADAANISLADAKRAVSQAAQASAADEKAAAKATADAAREAAQAAKEAAAVQKAAQKEEALTAKEMAKKAEAAAASAAEAQTKAQDQAARDAKAANDKTAASFQQGADKAKAAISMLGSAVVSVFTGQIPTASQAGAALGASIGGVLTGAADKASDALSKLGPAGAAAGAALQVVAAAASMTVGVLFTLAGLAVDVTQRMTLLRDSFAGLAGGAAGGKAVQDMLGHLDLPFATAQVNAWAASLVAAGVKGKALEEQTKAIAAAQASGEVFGKAWGAGAENFFTKMGEGGAQAKKMLEDIQKGGRHGASALKDMGLNIDELGGQAAVAKMSAQQLTEAVTKALQKRGEGPLADMALSLPVILQKAREGFMSLFGDLGPAVKPMMAAVKSFFGEFSKGGVAIQMLKPIVTAVFGAMFAIATKVFNTIHKGFLLVAIGALTVYIALRPLIEALGKFLASANMLTGLKVALFLLALPFIVIAAAIIGVIIVLGAIVSVIGLVVSAFLTLGGAIINGLMSIDFSGFVAKMSAMAQAGLAAFKGVFGIASPSKVMLEHGEENIAGAAATGVDKGGDKIDDAMGRMGGGPKGGGGKGKGGGGGEKHYHFHYTGPADEADSFFEQAAGWLERLDAEAPA